MAGAPRSLLRSGGRLCAAIVAILLACTALPHAQEQLPEYRLKTAILYNFAQFTEWPTTVGSALNLCILGPDPFGPEIDVLEGKSVGARHIVLQRKGDTDPTTDCQIAYLPASRIARLARMLDELRDLPILTVADSPGAASRGVVLNLQVAQGKVTFEVNLQSARSAHLKLRATVLRLATRVTE
jgi:hypothetical protein